MSNPGLAACALAVVVGFELSEPQVGQQELALDSLTVPAERLPDGCQAAQRTAAGTGKIVRSGWRAGLPIPTNPWRGDDRQIVAAIVERIEGPFREPDTPLLTPAERAQFRLRLADGVEEAYAAVYADAGTELVTVCAFRSDTTLRRSRLSSATSRRRAGLQFTVGRTSILVSGEKSSCFEPVAAYVRNLAAR